MQTFCTIVTADHLPYARVLYASLRRFEPSIQIHVLITDDGDYESFDGFKCISAPAISTNRSFSDLRRKYAHTNMDYFRWSLKPVLISYLLEKGFEKVIFADPDLYFINPFGFLFEILDSSSLIVTPHWNSIEPQELEESLLPVLRNGLYNAGLVGSSAKGLPAIKWWAEACHYKIDKQPDLGVYVDQKYLDILPVEYEQTCILKHRGCNLASWNMNSNKRTLVNGKLLINQEFDPVFIHFTADTIRHIQNGNDYLLQPYLAEYKQSFDDLQIPLPGKIYAIKNQQDPFRIKKIKRKLLLRTRFKKLLFKLAEKL